MGSLWLQQACQHPLRPESGAAPPGDLECERSPGVGENGSVRSDAEEQHHHAGDVDAGGVGEGYSRAGRVESVVGQCGAEGEGGERGVLHAGGSQVQRELVGGGREAGGGVLGVDGEGGGEQGVLKREELQAGGFKHAECFSIVHWRVPYRR